MRDVAVAVPWVWEESLSQSLHFENANGCDTMAAIEKDAFRPGHEGEWLNRTVTLGNIENEDQLPYTYGLV